ncbi:MAG: transglutaminase-like domain-containing protein, partial [Candidatus Spyradocola sp.]
ILRLGSRWRLSCLWATTLLCAGLIGLRVTLLPEDWLNPFLLLCAGWILYLPKATLGKEGRFQAQLLAALLAVPVLALALALGPETDGEWRSRALGYLVQDAQDLCQFYWGDSPGSAVTTMQTMGLQPQKDRLGGDINQPDNTPVITSSQNLLLRGQALEVYTGSGWRDGSENVGKFRYDSLIWGGRKSEAFGLNLPNERSCPPLNSLFTDVNANLRVTWIFRSVFLPYRTQSVRFSRDYGDLYFNLQGEAYWDVPPTVVTEYRIQARTWNFRDENFDKNMLLLEDALADKRDSAYEPIAERCLQLPETLPAWVEAFAQELTAECRSPYEKAMTLRDWLSDNCTYTLTPGSADNAQDFVAEFLTNRKGYCTYYASALTVLCRCAGVPARYVTGFGMSPEGKHYQASQATAHAWTEIYLRSIGWVPLDALDPEIFEREIPETSLSGDTAAEPPVTPSPTPSVDSEIMPEPEPENEFNPRNLLWLIPVALAVMAFFLAKRLRSRRFRLDNLRKKYPRTDLAAEHCYAGILRLLRILGLSPEKEETLLTFWERAAVCLPTDRDWCVVGQVMDRLRFGETPPDWQEVARLCERYAALEAHIHATQSLLKRLRV